MSKDPAREREDREILDLDVDEDGLQPIQRVDLHARRRAVVIDLDQLIRLRFLHGRFPAMSRDPHLVLVHVADLEVIAEKLKSIRL